MLIERRRANAGELRQCVAIAREDHPAPDRLVRAHAQALLDLSHRALALRLQIRVIGYRVAELPGLGGDGTALGRQRPENRVGVGDSDARADMDLGQRQPERRGVRRAQPGVAQGQRPLRLASVGGELNGAYDQHLVGREPPDGQKRLLGDVGGGAGPLGGGDAFQQEQGGVRTDLVRDPSGESRGHPGLDLHAQPRRLTLGQLADPVTGQSPPTALSGLARVDEVAVVLQQGAGVTRRFDGLGHRGAQVTIPGGGGQQPLQRSGEPLGPRPGQQLARAQPGLQSNQLACRLDPRLVDQGHRRLDRVVDLLGGHPQLPIA